MISDPSTNAGMDEARRRAAKRKSEAESVRNRTKNNPDGEPSGKLTNPNEINLHRDRKND